MIKNISDYVAPASGILSYNANGEIIHITQRGEVTVVNYSSIESAYTDMMTNALNSTASKYDISLTSQQHSLVDASLRVLNAITSAI